MEEMAAIKNLKVQEEDMGDVREVSELGIRKVGAELLVGDPGVRIAGWTIRTKKRAILKMDQVLRWERLLETTHLPEMVFGDSTLELLHEGTGLKIHFNAYDALVGWKKAKLPPVEVPAAAQWKFRSRPSQQVILDYDYTFTTPYCGSQTIDPKKHILKGGRAPEDTSELSLKWVECNDRIDLVALQAKDPILFYDEVVLYEDELADNGISLLSVKVRVMPRCWFLLLRYWLRVDGVLMRLRDSRMFCSFQSDPSVFPVVLRERCLKEETFQALALRGFPADAASYGDPSAASDRMRPSQQAYEKLVWENI